MTSRLRRRFRTALLALTCLLLAQWTLATHACPVIWQAGGLLAQAQIESQLAADASDCHSAFVTAAPEHAAGDSPPCVKHCADEGSTRGSASFAIVAAVAPPLTVRTSQPAMPGPVRWQTAPASSDATAPPLSILYCVFLI